MFSPALGRVVRSSGSLPARPAAAVLGVQQSFTRPTHQRRLSSSKASIPPDGSERPSSARQQTSPTAQKVPTRKPTGHTGRKRAPAAPALNLPHVPPTDHLQIPEVRVSSFFSLHRPISVTSTIPPVSNSASFDTLFQTKALNSRKNMNDTMDVLYSGIESLETALRIQKQKGGAEGYEDIHHLDGPPEISIDQVMAGLAPFRAPPVPMPFNQVAEAGSTSAQQESTQTTPPKQRAWSTAVVVTESTDASGKRTYSATAEPMVEIDVPAVENSQELDEFEIRQPFLERMRQRQNDHTRYRNSQGRPDMLAISVKRQRKLKMKKHKYKKLMKRTRLLRRKLDRL